jgi:hypothetical protein
MSILRWFGFDEDEEAVFLKLFRAEVAALERIVESSKAKERLLAPVTSANDPACMVALLATVKNLIDEALTRNNAFHLEESAKERALTHDYLADSVILRLRREFKQERVWNALRDELKKQRQFIAPPFSEEKLKQLKQSVEEERRILSLLETVTSSEISELHAHCAATVPLRHIFKRIVEIARDPVKFKYLCAQVEDAKTKMYPADYKTWQRLLREFKKGRSDALLRKEFEEMIEVKREHGEWAGFEKKDSALRPLWWALEGYTGMKNGVQVPGDIGDGVASLYAIGDDLYRHGVRHFELRYPALTNGLPEMAAAQELLDKEGKGIQLRMIIFCVAGNPATTDEDINKCCNSTRDLFKRHPDAFRKFIVGIDYSGPYNSLERNYTKDLAMLSDLGDEVGIHKFVLHIGEVFDGWQKMPMKERFATLKVSLDHLQQAAEFPGVKRLGHATVLGIEFSRFFSKRENTQLAEQDMKLEELEAQRERIADIIRKNGIAIEANPISNIRIANLHDIALHPAKWMLEKNLLVTVSTDDRSLFGTHIQKELFDLAHALRLKQAELERIIANAHAARL